MKLKEFAEVYVGNFNVIDDATDEYLLTDINDETYEADPFRVFDDIEIQLITIRNNKTTIFCIKTKNSK